MLERVVQAPRLRPIYTFAVWIGAIASVLGLIGTSAAMQTIRSARSEKIVHQSVGYRSDGRNLTNRALFVSASGAQVNYALRTQSSDNYFNETVGNTGLGFASTDQFTVNGNMRVYGKITLVSPSGGEIIVSAYDKDDVCSNEFGWWNLAKKRSAMSYEIEEHLQKTGRLGRRCPTGPTGRSWPVVESDFFGTFDTGSGALNATGIAHIVTSTRHADANRLVSITSTRSAGANNRSNTTIGK